MSRTLLFTFAGVLLLALNSCNQATRKGSPGAELFYPDSLESAASRMAGYVDQGKFAGIAVEVLSHGEVVQQRFFGYADLEKEVPIDPGTFYRVFSMSKPVTAVALMTLFDEGRFSLDDPLHHHLPFFAKTMVYTPEEGGFSLQPQAEPITIRHLLTHTAGFTYGWEQGSHVDSIYNVTGVTMWDAPLEEKMKLLSTIPLKY